MLLNIPNVLYVPTCGRNLLATEMLREQSIGMDLMSVPKKAVLHCGKIKLVSNTNKRNRLCIGKRSKKFEANAISVPLTLELWHRRLGHASLGKLEKLIGKELVRGLVIQATIED
ncbi:hypothetical protein DAPPUDRAFT_345677 [Daphnia pulex]|uniref:GAG-pre-integrase domain-containing protein n=1 Tax=Daphnia pulex TaxID=6669 RepID=E9I7I7_DAPPU|nr:hypothetical protein DAPPUDRAFT_345677 [Daphnia pulex]|eukprot:EFX60043.1 hypothetical protein DAPPUDRAFT_345677 [Daphnia pulex]